MKHKTSINATMRMTRLDSSASATRSQGITSGEAVTLSRGDVYFLAENTADYPELPTEDGILVEPKVTLPDDETKAIFEGTAKGYIIEGAQEYAGKGVDMGIFVTEDGDRFAVPMASFDNLPSFEDAAKILEDALKDDEKEEDKKETEEESPWKKAIIYGVIGGVVFYVIMKCIIKK